MFAKMWSPKNHLLSRDLSLVFTYFYSSSRGPMESHGFASLFHQFPAPRGAMTQGRLAAKPRCQIRAFLGGQRSGEVIYEDNLAVFISINQRRARRVVFGWGFMGIKSCSWSSYVNWSPATWNSTSRQQSPVGRLLGCSDPPHVSRARQNLSQFNWIDSIFRNC